MLITYFQYVESLLVTFQNLPTFLMPCCPILLLGALNLANSLTSLIHCPSVHDFWAGPQHSFSILRMGCLLFHSIDFFS